MDILAVNDIFAMRALCSGVQFIIVDRISKYCSSMNCVNVDKEVQNFPKSPNNHYHLDTINGCVLF
jgi:hypothetical protein